MSTTNSLIKKIDLHSHTHFSDGHLSPTELVLRAHNMQVDVLAITDHDTVAGLAEAYATQALQKRPLEIVAGVEISTAWHGFDIHIVGLNVDPDDNAFQCRLQEQAQRRDERAQRIAAKLAACGFTDILEKAQELASVGQLTRAHFARILVRDYGIDTMEKAFKLYLGKGKRAAVKAQWPEIAEAIQWIQQAKGQAVLAHPAHYDMSTKWLRRLVAEFAAHKGDAIEVAFPGIAAQKRDIIYQLAVEHKLLASVGSDFHFPSRWTELGRNLGFADYLTPIWHDWQLAQ